MKLNYESLYERAKQSSTLYKETLPFPHIVIDDFLEEDVVNTLFESFPSQSDIAWWKYDNVFEKKLAQNNALILPPVYREIFKEFNSGEFIKFLEQLTSISGLLPDPHLGGGGLHQILPGGKLDVHADFNFHNDLWLHRRLNMLVYLNKEWKDEWNGHLELWDKGMLGCEKKIAPIFNRCVIFSTTDTAFHGHPEILLCPDGMSRKSIAMYYYTGKRPAIEVSRPHSTLYQRRPQDVISTEVEMLRKKRAVGRI